MSMRFLTKLAGGVALGSAALLLGAPATALAAPDGPTKEPKASNQEQEKKSDDKPKTFNLRDKQGNGVVCATNKQINELTVANVFSDNIIEDSVVVFNQSAAGVASNDLARILVVCIRDLDVDAEVEVDLLSDLLDLAEGGAGSPVGQRAGNTPALGGASAGPDGAWVLPGTAGVAAGDGGAFSDTNTGALTAAGAGMMGVGVLGGIALLRRRSADGTVA